MTFLDLFSGIGGFRIAMEQAGHTCVGHCEIDKYANQSYIAMHKPRECEWYADDLYIVILDEHKIMIKLRDALWDAIEVYDNANILSIDSIRTGLKPLLDIATHVVKEYESEQE